MTLKGDAKFKGKLTCGLKNNFRNFLNFRKLLMQAVESLEICTLMGFFCPKHIKIQIKKYRRVMSHDTEE